MRVSSLMALGLMAILVGVADPAAAETRPPPGPGGGAYVADGGTPTATARDVISVPGGRGGGGAGGPAAPCHWEVLIADDSKFTMYSADTFEPLHSATGRWLQYVCDGIGAVAVNGLFQVPEGGLVDPAALAEKALKSVRIASPAIRTSPSAQARLYVRVPTWLWLDRSWWRTYQATAAARRVTSTVVARPVTTEWSLGDGTSIRCVGPGTPWRRGLAEDATACLHTYRTSSAGRRGGTLPIRVTVRLEVTWSSSTGAGGTLTAIGRTSTVDVEVGEIQAVGTG